MNKLTTKRITALGLLSTAGAIASAAILYAPMSHADTGADAEFLHMLSDQGFASENGGAGLITAGHAVCAAILPFGVDNFTAQAAEAKVVQRNNPSLTLDSAQTFVAISIVNYCGWEIPSVTNPAPAPAPAPRDTQSI